DSSGANGRTKTNLPRSANVTFQLTEASPGPRSTTLLPLVVVPLTSLLNRTATGASIEASEDPSEGIDSDTERWLSSDSVSTELESRKRFVTGSKISSTWTGLPKWSVPPEIRTAPSDSRDAVCAWRGIGIRA